MRCVCRRGGDNPPGLSLCRRSDPEGPVSPLGRSVGRCPGPDGLCVSPHRGIGAVTYERESGDKLCAGLVR